MSISTGCVDIPCSGWEQPADCCDACEGEEAETVLAAAWLTVSEWLFAETGYDYPGTCLVATNPCPPCGCPRFCTGDCGIPWSVIDLSPAFCYPIRVVDGVPRIQFQFGSINPVAVNPGSDTFGLRPDLQTLDVNSQLWTSDEVNESCCAYGWPVQNPADQYEWTIVAEIGADPPRMMIDAAARFACEIAKDCLGKESCLPDGVTSITRRGLTQDLTPEFSETISFDNEGTGIPILDIVLRRYGAGRQSTASHFDPLARLDERLRRSWSFRGVLNPPDFI